MAEIRNPDGSLQLQNAAAENISKLAHELANGYFAYSAAMAIAMDHRSDALIPEILPGQNVPVGLVKSKRGGNHNFHFGHFLDQARNHQNTVYMLERIYLSGALLTLGDALDQYGYFDRAPILEMLRHLRNGIAHGNRFNIVNPGSLTNHPAHDVIAHHPLAMNFHITAALNGTVVLFDFMEPGDVVHVLNEVGFHLMDLAYGVER